MIIVAIFNSFYKDISINYFYFFIIAIILIIICLILSRNSLLNSKVALRSSSSLRIIIFKNKDLKDIENLNIKVIKFV